MASQIEDLQIPKLSIPITIKSINAVLPAGPIPVKPGDSLYLSNLDDVVGSRVFTPTIYFYHSNNSKTSSKTILKTLYDALSAVLVPYYPFSGRLRETKNGKLEVFFESGQQGALIVEAETTTMLADLRDLVVPNPAWSPLIYHFPNEGQYKIINMPLVIAQFTYFSCGGFSLGLRLCHCLCDGFGAMQFLNAWATTARTGILVASPTPCWDREYFHPRDPPNVSCQHREYTSVEDTSTLTNSLWQVKPLQKCYIVSKQFQDQIKFLAHQNGNISCSTFDAMAAHVWKSWVKALNVKPLDFNLRLTFAVNTRHMLKNPPLKDGFYGNAVCLACVASSVEELITTPLSDTTRLVHEARMNASSEEYLRSTVDYIDVNRPRRLEFGGKLTITQWTRFRIYESADFGWGKPEYAGPIDLTPTPQVCVFLPAEVDSDGKMVVCICLPPSASDRFQEYFCSMRE